MMGTLFLSGGGDREQTREIDAAFAAEVDRSKPVLYIPVAMDESHISYDSCYEWIKRTLFPLGLREISMWVDLSQRTIEELRGFSAVYIGGGNTYSLLKNFSETGFHTLLDKFLAEGGIVYGGSAGAIIMGASILTCAHMDENAVGLNSFNGLSLMEDYSIWCHYEEKDDPLVRGLWIQREHQSLL
ncbi:hypothetical protein KH172YL63_17340 [Bacillus sp. KH172YL63]|nr:hypothetical protein KH172YL63_17340 [Bacillus sp. KH172YL63]